MAKAPYIGERYMVSDATPTSENGLYQQALNDANNNPKPVVNKSNGKVIGVIALVMLGIGLAVAKN